MLPKIEIVSNAAFDNIESVMKGGELGRFKLYNATGGTCDSITKDLFTNNNQGAISTSMPSDNVGAIDYTMVSGSVLKALQADTVQNQYVFNQIAFPSSMSSFNLIHD